MNTGLQFKHWLFRQRWYLLADNYERMAIYSLDRMLSATLTDKRFKRPADFSSEQHFAEYFGVMVDGTPMEHVVVRAYGKMANLLRTLPLHTSQRESEKQQLVAEVKAKPMEIHNHFESGSSAQVFNSKVNGGFEKAAKVKLKKSDKKDKKDKKRWKRIVRIYK